MSQKPLTREEKETIAKVWDRDHTDQILALKLGWMSHECLLAHINTLRFGDPKLCTSLWLKKNFFPTAAERALSLGCGTGGFERSLVLHHVCRVLDAYDISEEALQKAQEHADAEGLESINFRAQDINEIALPKRHYDLVCVDSAFHHFLNLEHITDQIYRCLKPHGLLYVNDYVGPSRFQWSDTQLEIINDILKVLPPSYRQTMDEHGKSLGLKDIVSRPDRESVRQFDPSEAVRSAEIVPVIRRHFTILRQINYGGTLMDALFRNMAFNFKGDDERDVAILRLIALFERTLVALGYLASDYTLIVARKKAFRLFR